MFLYRTDEFISDTLLRYTNLVQDPDFLDDISAGGSGQVGNMFDAGLDDLNIESLLALQAAGRGLDKGQEEVMNDQVIHSVYQEVESEPLHL